MSRGSRKISIHLVSLFFIAMTARAQIQVDLKFRRLQYVAHEPIIATIKITNRAGRAIDLSAGDGRHWFGFEVKTSEGRLLAPLPSNTSEPDLRVEAGETATRQIDLSPLFPVSDPGAYHVRANVYLAGMKRFFYSSARVIQTVDARPIWQRSVGIPEGKSGAGEGRTYSLLSNRFPDHTSLYVRVEDPNSGVVYATYSLGRVITHAAPQAELDRSNQLHVLHCASPQNWAYSHIGLNGELLAHSTFMETRTRPHLRQTSDGAIAVGGGRIDDRSAGVREVKPAGPPRDR